MTTDKPICPCDPEHSPGRCDKLCCPDGCVNTPTTFIGADMATGPDRAFIELRCNATVVQAGVVDSIMTVLVAHRMGVHPDRLEPLPVLDGTDVVARWRVKP